MDRASLGQYFTTSERLQGFVCDSVRNIGEPLLEPSFGAGHLLKRFIDTDKDYPMVCFELDKRVTPVVEFNNNQDVRYVDFLSADLGDRLFKTIVGNPPFVKNKAGNLYIRFIAKCYELLSDG